MAKQKGAVKLSGKIGEVVFTDGKYGKNAKSKPKLTEEQRKKKAELPQNKRTGYLNKISSGIRNAVEYYAGALLHGEFYSGLASHFRNEKSNERLLLLAELKDLEVHPDYRFGKLCPLPGIELNISKMLYTAEVEIKDPAYKYGSSNCFYLQFILLVWNREDDNCRHMAESTPWIQITDKTAKYTTVKFKRTAKDTEYILACRCALGVNGVEYGYTQSGMQFLNIGSVTAEGKKMLEEKKAAKLAALREVKEKEVVREKPRLKLRDKK